MNFIENVLQKVEKLTSLWFVKKLCIVKIVFCSIMKGCIVVYDVRMV